MTASLKPYHAYKPSGVEWLGEVPSHWEIKKIKHGYDIQLGKMLQPDKKSRKDIEKPYLRAANLSWEGALLEDVKSMWFSPEELEKFKLQKGDVLISEGGDVGRSCYWDSDLELYIQNAMTRVRLKSKTCFSKYLYYWMYHLKNIGQIDSICNAATIAHFTADKVKETLLLEPPIDEQHRTAAFLDQKTAEIDEAISKKQRLIDLLKEQKVILINQAITKGMNPNVPMRESGVEWIGEVPAHWEVKKVKHLFRLVADPAPPNNDMELLSIYTDTGVRPRRELEERGNRATTTDGYWKVKKGDFIVNKLLAWMGAIGLSSYEGVTSPAYDILRPQKELVSEYFHYLFRTPQCTSELKRYSRGIMEMRLRLYFDKFGMVLVPFPPTEEQAAIAAMINLKELEFEEAIERVQKEISLLQEYRLILIANVVTGKLDVREDTHRGS